MSTLSLAMIVLVLGNFKEISSHLQPPLSAIFLYTVGIPLLEGNPFEFVSKLKLLNCVAWSGQPCSAGRLRFRRRQGRERGAMGPVQLATKKVSMTRTISGDTWRIGMEWIVWRLGVGSA